MENHKDVILHYGKCLLDYYGKNNIIIVDRYDYENLCVNVFSGVIKI